MPARRHFGSVRKLPSGRYQASYWHLAERHLAPDTFTTKGEAYAWLSTVEADDLKGAWIAPSAGSQTFGDYAGDWLSRRRDLRPRTRELYEYLLDSYLLPAFRNFCLADLTLTRIRLWHGALVTEHPALAPKAYRLLKAILNAAVEDRRLVANPCQIKGAAAEHPDERPVATVAEVEALADAVAPRYKAMVLLAAWCSLRFGELACLTRRRVNPIQGLIEVQQTLTETNDGHMRLGPPKTKAGRRTVAIPPHVMPALKSHLETQVGPTPDSLLFPRRRERATSDGATSPGAYGGRPPGRWACRCTSTISATPV
ncbi:MAG: site-specific integrase [Acidimicrobiales bacterium]